MKQNFLKVVVKRVGEEPVIENVKNELHSLQRIVGGHIECVSLPRYVYHDEVISLEEAFSMEFKNCHSVNIDIVLNEEGKLLNECEANIKLSEFRDIVFGDIFFVGVDNSEGDFTSLCDEQIKIVFEYLEKNKIMDNEKDFYNALKRKYI